MIDDVLLLMANIFSILAYIYPGKENSIYISQRYVQEFSCHFRLEYYPFDTQVFTTFD